MNIKQRLTILSFLQFFIWGSWLISTGYYFEHSLNFKGIEIGGIFSTLGIASLIMPAILGIVADKWVNAEKLLGICHLAGAFCLIMISFVKDPVVMFWVMLLNSMAYMPTIALNNAVSYKLLSQAGFDIQKTFPPIRVFGTIGFIVAMWLVDLTGFSKSNYQYYLAAASAIAMGLYSFNLPPCKPVKTESKNTFMSKMGLDALVLLKQERMVVFFLFSMLLGAALQITNIFGKIFLSDFGDKGFASYFVVKHDLVLLSLSQISESLFILTIPYFLKKFGIKIVMVISIFAWILRFGFFGIGDPDPNGGLIFLILSMIVYGMAFDFFNISGSLFVERETPSAIRSSAQGLFMMVTNGLGAIIGGIGSGWVVDYWTENGIKDWTSIWFSFAAYAFVLLIFFPLLFKYRHYPEDEYGETRRTS
jgi:NHS family xanthosine MFS transporter